MSKSENALTTAQIGSIIIGIDRHHKDMKRRPFFAWSLLADQSQELTYVEAFKKTTTPAKHKYPSDLDIRTDKDSRLQINTTNCLKNIKDNYVDPNENFDLNYLPDIILRRTYALLYKSAMASGSLRSEFEKSNFSVRHGIVLPITAAEIKCKDPRFLALDVIDAPIEQVPFEIPGYFDQDDIDHICRIGKNHTQFCFDNGLSVKFPEPGTFEEWDDAFWAFGDIEPQERSNSIPNDVAEQIADQMINSELARLMADL